VSELRFFEELGAELEQAARRPRASRRPRLWAAVGASSVALSGGIVAAVLALSAGAPAAFAEWSRVPTTPTPSALEAAVHKCYKVGSGDAQLSVPAPGGTTKPVLAEARGASAAAIYVMDGQVYMCLTVNGSAFSSVDSYQMGPSLRQAPGPDQLGVPYGVSGGSGRSGPTHPLTKAQLQKLRREPPLGRRPRTSLFGVGGDFALGQAGGDVSSVTFAFANGKTVIASIENGWYFAWWPWSTEPTSVRVTTKTGTTTSPMGKFPHDGFGQRPYPACKPGSSGCVFAANQQAITTSTSTGATTEPTTTSPQLATATQTCDSFSMSTQAVPADVFVSRPALTDAHGVYTALINVSKGRVYGCLTGGDQKDLHSFFEQALVAFGPVDVAPGPDQLSVPYTQEGEGGSGRSFGGPPGRNASQAELEARRARSQGGGYGPYTLGKAGSDISAVKFTFANGKTTAAIVQNGWYFVWWPWISKPVSVTITTSSRTITSPLTVGANSDRTPVAPGCHPGSRGCVFVTTPSSP
jgi:hypothetical protein